MTSTAIERPKTQAAPAKVTGTALSRLGRGLRGLPPVIVAYLIDADGLDDVTAAADGDPTSKAKIVHRQSREERRANATTFLGTSGAWLTGGWMALPTLPAAFIYAALCLSFAGSVAVAWKGKGRNGWLWPARLGVILAASLACEWLHLMAGTPVPVMILAYVATLLTLIWYIAEDGDPGNELGIVKADAVATDTRYNRIVEGFATKLGIKPDAEQIRVIGAGMEPVDQLWSRMRMQFPGTTTNDQIRAAVPGVASFLGISAERLDAVSVDDGHGGEIQGVIDVWLASGDQWKVPPEWPLLDAAKVSVWRPAPFIVTDRGAPVLVSLLFAAWMFIAKPRHGKTFAMRLLALVFALDPEADYVVFDFKPGGRDWFWAKSTAIVSGYGNSDATVEAFRDYLKGVAEDPSRGEAFQALPEELAREGQLTREACAHDRRLRPLGIFADEVHHAFMHPKFGKEIGTLVAKIEREQPFLAVAVYLASQRADVRTSIPSEVRSLIANRVAGKLYTSRDSGDVLGDAANDLGHNAKNLRDVKGLFIVHGADDTSSFDGYTRGRAYKVDNVQAAELGAKALELRKAAGAPLPVGERAPEQADIPEDLGAAIDILRGDGVVSMRSEELASRMGTTAQRLIARIGVSSRYNYDDSKLKHLFLEDLEAAANGTRPGLRVVS